MPSPMGPLPPRPLLLSWLREHDATQALMRQLGVGIDFIVNTVSSKIDAPDTEIVVGNPNNWGELMADYYDQLEAGLFADSSANPDPSADKYYTDFEEEPSTIYMNGSSEYNGTFIPAAGDNPDIQLASGAGVVALVPLVRALAPTTGRQLLQGAPRLGLGATWRNLPSWAKRILEGIGVTSVYEIFFDREPGDLLSELFGESSDGSMVVFKDYGVGDVILIGKETYMVASFWTANNIRFYRFRDGHLGVQKKTGVWKVWKPKKGMMLYADGATDLKTALKADRALSKQAGKIAKMLRNRGYTVNRGRKS